MTEQDVKVFVRGIERFFSATTAMPVTIKTPFVMQAGDRVDSDFAAVIGVSGTQRGVVYYSAPRAMVADLVTYVGETLTTDEIFADYVGEIANTISGNAREHFDSGFMISTPIVLRGAAAKPSTSTFPPDVPAFVIPLEWQSFISTLVVCLRDDDSPHEIDIADLERALNEADAEPADA